jgi:DNA-binding response OmpR family regulator
MTADAPDSGRTRLLMIDDDKKLCRLVSTYLTPLGFDVTAVHTGPEGVERATAAGETWHALILDVMLPGIDGFEVLKRIRAKSTVPVLMLTARGDETDRIVGLEVGADDYLPKTFSTRELLARLRAVLRRSALSAAAAPGSDAPPKEVVVGELRLNLDARSAVMGAEPLMLTPVEFDLLASLAKAKGRIKSREALLDEARDRNYDVFDRSIDLRIMRLRRKIERNPDKPEVLKTVRNVGYVFVSS